MKQSKVSKLILYSQNDSNIYSYIFFPSSVFNI